MGWLSPPAVFFMLTIFFSKFQSVIQGDRNGGSLTNDIDDASEFLGTAMATTLTLRASNATVHCRSGSPGGARNVHILYAAWAPNCQVHVNCSTGQAHGWPPRRARERLLDGAPFLASYIPVCVASRWGSCPANTGREMQKTCESQAAVHSTIKGVGQQVLVSGKISLNFTMFEGGRNNPPTPHCSKMLVHQDLLQSLS
jgi:hypothetical protein